MLILTNTLEEELNNAFKDLFMGNYLWLIILAIATAIIALLYMISHSYTNNANINNLYQKINTIEKQIDILDQRFHSSSSTSETATLESISEQLKELKNEIKK